MCGFGLTSIALMISGICEMNDKTVVSDIFAIVLIGCFQLSIGPAFWIYITETLPDKGVALCSAVNWGALVVVSIITPYILNNKMDRGGLYLFFMAFQIIVLLYTLYIYIYI